MRRNLYVIVRENTEHEPGSDEYGVFAQYYTIKDGPWTNDPERAAYFTRIEVAQNIATEDPDGQAVVATVVQEGMFVDYSRVGDALGWEPTGALL